jgi:hypothetical protein
LQVLITFSSTRPIKKPPMRNRKVCLKIRKELFKKPELTD